MRIGTLLGLTLLAAFCYVHTGQASTVVKVGPGLKPGEEASRPQPAKCPVDKPAQVPEKLKVTFSEATSTTLEERIEELKELTRAKRDDECVDPLRWLGHQTDKDIELRHHALMVLGSWNVLSLPGDLKGMMNDPNQSPDWRARAVEHLGFHYSSYMNKHSLEGLEAAMASGDEVVRDAAALAMARLAREYSWQHVSPQRFEKVMALVDQTLKAPRPQAVLNGITAVGFLQLKERAPAMEEIAADAKQPAEVRIAAVHTLRNIARPGSLAAIEKCLADPHAELSAAAKQAKPFALVAQLAGHDPAAREKAYAALYAMGLEALPALTPVLDGEAGEVQEYARTILGDAILKDHNMKLVDRTGLKNAGDKPDQPKPVWFNLDRKLIVLEAEICQDRSALEYAVVAKGENAKLHEAVIAVSAKPIDVIYALLGCGYTYAGEMSEDGKFKLPKGAGVMLSVEFEREKLTPQGKQKEKVRVPLEALIWNTDTRATMRRVPFAFTGSKVKDLGGRPVLMAEVEKSVVAIMTDPHAIMNCILDAAADADVNPEQGAFYIANRMLVPKTGTKVELIFEPWTGDALKAEDLSDRDKSRPPPEKRGEDGKDAPPPAPPGLE